MSTPEPRHDSPLDRLSFSNSFAALGEAFFSRVLPTRFEAPAELVHFNGSAASLIDLDSDVVSDPGFVPTFSGARLPEGSDPLAMLYAGHQFGHYVPQLGDGRAIMLGEVTTSASDKWELQLKGSGRTPYSRDGDGRAVLRSSIREYLCSEAMHGLGIPTTRALCLVTSDEEVYRERIETGAMVTRMAPSHVRFGSFEVFFYRDQPEQIKQLADYVIRHDYPELAGTAQPYAELFREVVERTAKLIARWQAVGFAHGVMNTDNMSILGLTLDYGPFGFMERYDPGFICNHSDHTGRYAFDKQPQVGLWNLTCLAQALSPLVDVETARDALATYQDVFFVEYKQLMASKMGFDEVTNDNMELTGRFIAMMEQSGADYTRSFRALNDVSQQGGLPHNYLQQQFAGLDAFHQWFADYKTLLTRDAVPDSARQQKMRQTNPKYILRNYMAQTAIDKAEREKDYAEIDRLMRVLQRPYDEHPETDHYAGDPPGWASQLQVSCSS
jgi:uncharacterized protein YdiU (UPF0061 family)